MEGYGQYCPLAKGAEVFAERWTPLILRELLRGSSAFNDSRQPGGSLPRLYRNSANGRSAGIAPVFAVRSSMLGSSCGTFDVL